MIVLVFLLTLPLLLGFTFSQLLPVKLYRFERLAIAYPIGILFFTWLLFTSSLILGQSLGHWLSIFLTFVFCFLALKESKKSKTLVFKKNPQRISFLIFFIFWTAILAQLFYSHMLPEKQGKLYSAGAAWSDLALHSTYVSYFSQQEIIDLHSPIYAQENTSYPFLFDYYSASLHRNGMSIGNSFLIPGFSIVVCLLILTFFLCFRISENTAHGWILSILFLSNGGMGFIYFWKDYLASNLPLYKFLFRMKFEYAHLADYSIRWSNIIVDYLLPQRGFLIGLTMTVGITLGFWLLNNTSKRKHRQQLLKFLAVTIGLLPFFHIHSFLFLLCVFIALSFFWWREKFISLKTIFTSLLITMLIAGPQLLWQFSQTMGNGFLRLHIGWMKNEQESIILFWFQNMGVTALLLISGLILIIKERKLDFLRLLFLLGISCFAICNLIIFQPHNYDNMKFMLLGFFYCLMFISFVLSKLWLEKKIVLKFSIALLIIAASITGFLSILRESYISSTFANREDIDIAVQLRRKTPIDSVFLTADGHSHLVPMLAGRKIVMGYRGWLWTHGIDYSQTEKAVEKMFRGGEEAEELFGEYNVNYVFIGQKELQDWPVDEQYFQDNYPLLIAEPEARVYIVN